MIIAKMSDNPDLLKIDLPAENWLDIFVYFPRLYLVEQLSLVCRHFWSVAQIHLHEHGKITLGKLLINSRIVPSSDYEGNSNKCPQQKAVLCKIGGQQLSAQSLPFPEVPMPANISAFEQLIIGYVDKQVLGMLSKMSHLLTNVNCIWLDFDEDIPGQDTVALSMLQKVYPFFCTVKLLQLPCAPVIKHLNERFPKILENLVFLEIDEYVPCQTELLAIISTWLHSTQLTENVPRMALCRFGESNILKMAELLRKDFLSATGKNEYYVVFPNADVNFELSNSKTGETLKAKIRGGSKNPHLKFLLINCYQDASNRDEKWLDEKFQEIMEYRRNKEQSGQIIFRVDDDIMPAPARNSVNRDVNCDDKAEGNMSDD